MTTIRANLRINALTQYGGFNFNSFCVWNGRPIGAGPDGIFVLDGDGGKDIHTTTSDERNVSAWFELPVTQLGNDHIKRGRRLYLGGEFSGSMTVAVRTNDASEQTITYAATPRNTSNLQHVLEIPLNHRQRSEYWGFTVSNVNGSDFSIDFIDGVFIQVNRRLGL